MRAGAAAELAELEAMYSEEEFAAKTKELVLARSRRNLEHAQRALGCRGLAIGLVRLRAGCLGRRHDAERDVARLIVPRVRVRHVVGERADRGRPRRHAWLFALRHRRRVAAGNQPRSRRLHVALDAGDLPAALGVHRRLIPAVRAIMMSGEPGATMAKAAVQAAGVIAGRTMRLPLVTATDAQVEALRAALAEAELV